MLTKQAGRLKKTETGVGQGGVCSMNNTVGEAGSDLDAPAVGGIGGGAATGAGLTGTAHELQ